MVEKICPKLRVCVVATRSGRLALHKFIVNSRFNPFIASVQFLWSGIESIQYTKHIFRKISVCQQQQPKKKRSLSTYLLNRSEIRQNYKRSTTYRLHNFKKHQIVPTRRAIQLSKERYYLLYVLLRQGRCLP